MTTVETRKEGEPRLVDKYLERIESGVGKNAEQRFFVCVPVAVEKKGNAEVELHCRLLLVVVAFCKGAKYGVCRL